MKLLVLLPAVMWLAGGQSFDIAINKGRVIDPESGLDAVRHLGIRGTSIAVVSRTPLKGKREIGAKGLVVSPGFIDLHQHGQTDENYRLKAQDGCTTALELEIGVSPVGSWYTAREGKGSDQFRRECKPRDLTDDRDEGYRYLVAEGPRRHRDRQRSGAEGNSRTHRAGNFRRRSGHRIRLQLHTQSHAGGAAESV